MTLTDRQQRFHDEWLGLVQPVEGLVFSTPVLVDAQIAPDVASELTARFRALLAHDPDARTWSANLRRLLADFLGYDQPGMLVPREQLTDSLRFYAEEGRQEVRPSLAIARTPAACVPIGLLTSGRELRLIYAPTAESTSHLTFRFADMVEPAGRPILAAFQLILGARRTYQAAPEHTVEGLLRESRRRQADVTRELAEQVFEAVELLLEGFEQAAQRDAGPDRADWLRAALDAPHDHLYRGVLSVILRLVFILYAEDQNLLPVGHPTYSKHLSVQGLYADLVEDAGMHPESMHHRFGAYGRLLALFRAVFLGVRHGDLVLPPRQGRLFDPSSYPFLEGGLSTP